MGGIYTAGGRTETFAHDFRLETETCPSCGVLFAAPERLLDQARADGRTVYCPNGHHMSWSDTAEKKLERERARSGRLAAERDQAQAQARAEKAAKTRIKNSRDRERTRVGNGVCPCCNRSFQNLRRHMETKHPDHAHDHAGPAA